jgi:hypothetical protein
LYGNSKKKISVDRFYSRMERHRKKISDLEDRTMKQTNLNKREKIKWGKKPQKTKL